VLSRLGNTQTQWTEGGVRVGIVRPSIVGGRGPFYFFWENNTDHTQSLNGGDLSNETNQWRSEKKKGEMPKLAETQDLSHPQGMKETRKEDIWFQGPLAALTSEKTDNFGRRG